MIITSHCIRRKLIRSFYRVPARSKSSVTPPKQPSIVVIHPSLVPAPKHTRLADEVRHGSDLLFMRRIQSCISWWMMMGQHDAQDDDYLDDEDDASCLMPVDACMYVWGYHPTPHNHDSICSTKLQHWQRRLAMMWHIKRQSSYAKSIPGATLGRVRSGRSRALQVMPMLKVCSSTFHRWP